MHTCLHALINLLFLFDGIGDLDVNKSFSFLSKTTLGTCGELNIFLSLISV